MTQARSGAEYARELERQAATYPDERCEILLEAAHHWRLAGDPSRALQLLEQVRALGGVDADYARATLAEICFERGDDREAWAHIARLEESRVSDPGPAELVAELLLERGNEVEALRWFDLAISRLEADELARVRNSKYPTVHSRLLIGRQQCRTNLGLPPDGTDRLAQEVERRRLALVSTLERQAAHDRQPRLIRMLVWQREQQRLAAERWPDLVTSNVVGNHATVENRLRHLATAHPGLRVELVTGHVEDFAAYLQRTGQDPREEQTRLSYSNEAHGRGLFLGWPPERNKPCWCGSDRKYKKCCGAPQPVSTPTGG